MDKLLEVPFVGYFGENGELDAGGGWIWFNAGAVASDRDTVIIQSSHALVGRDYSFNGTYEDIRNHYDTELRYRGWQFVDERKLKNWSQDFGERDLNYCKEGMWVEAFYAGSLASKQGYIFGVNVSPDLTPVNRLNPDSAASH